MSAEVPKPQPVVAEGSKPQPVVADAASSATSGRGLADGARWSLYLLLILISAALMLARVARVRSPDSKSPTPFASANDRSRWATIRALVDDGTYSIDHIIFNRRGDRVRGWHTIDLVKHRARDGREHYYSSKPTLLPTLLAGEYWLVKSFTGATLAGKPHFVARIMLALTNVLPLTLSLLALAALIDRLSDSDAARIGALAAACFATFVTTFANTLNNHLIGAVCLAFGLALIVPMWRDGRFGWGRMALAGLTMGFLAANELPALSICVLAAVGLVWKAPLQTFAAYVPAVAAVAAASLGTNYIAHADWRTPYAHRGDGPLIVAVAASAERQLEAGMVPADVLDPLRARGIELSERAIVEPRIAGRRWVLWDEVSQRRFAVVKNAAAEPARAIEVREWDHWYDYEGSNWLPRNLKGIDRGEQSPLVYAFHVFLGHHGLFSLTPIWLLSAAGCWIWWRRGDRTQRTLAVLTVVITLVVLAFYLSRPQIDRNYGGWTCCLRWLIWLTPLWLVTLLPAVAALWRWRVGRWPAGQAAFLSLLAVSVFSAHYAADNPWSHPWLYDYWTWLGWIRY